MVFKTYIKNSLNYKLNDTVEELVLVTKRLRCGQDFVRNNGSCSAGPVSRVSANALPKCSCNFEHWLKDVMLEDDEPTDSFCICQMNSEVDMFGMDQMANNADSLNCKSIAAAIEPETAPKVEEDILSNMAENHDDEYQSDTADQAKRNDVAARQVRLGSVLNETSKATTLTDGEQKFHKKNKGRNNTPTRYAESDDHIATLSKDIKQFTRSLYPGVNCGHKNCISPPIITPKNLGWLWSLKETGGVKVKLLANCN